MEMYLYKCEKCGFAYRVPAYWLNYEQPPIYEFVHTSLESKETCEEMNLCFVEAV